jgi:hypothetical protein
MLLRDRLLWWKVRFFFVCVSYKCRIPDTDSSVHHPGLVATEFVWVVDLGTLSLDGAETLPIFYLGVNASDSNEDFQYETAHYINITTEAVTTSSSASSSPTTSSSAPTSSSTSSKATSTSTQSAVGTSTSSNTPTSSPSTDTGTKKSGGLSTGAAAGIAVACTLIVVSFLAGLGYFYYRNRKLRRQLAQATASVPVESEGWMKPELGVSGARGELAAPVAELAPGYHLGHELDGREAWNR